MVLEKKSLPIGSPGEVVKVDESKFEKVNIIRGGILMGFGFLGE